jgi:hypothetical protein
MRGKDGRCLVYFNQKSRWEENQLGEADANGKIIWVNKNY